MQQRPNHLFKNNYCVVKVVSMGTGEHKTNSIHLSIEILEAHINPFIVCIFLVCYQWHMEESYLKFMVTRIN